MIKIVDKNTREILQPGSLYHTERIKNIFVEAQSEEVYLELQSGRFINIHDSVYALPEVKKDLFKFDYVVDTDYNMHLVDLSNCNFTYDDSMRIIGNKLFDPELNIIFNTTQKYYYDKVQLKESIIMREFDIQFLSVFGNEKVYLYLYYEFLSERHVKPIATLSLQGIELFNGQVIPQRDILREFDKPKTFIEPKKKAVSTELINTVYNSLPEKLFEINIAPSKLMELLKDYKGYFKIHVVDPKLKLVSKFDKPSNQIMLIKTKFPQITKAFDFDFFEFNVSEQIKKD